ncbi:beta-galactosidase, partial [bacterium]|nr:beta-galactosidase [bacterium]
MAKRALAVMVGSFCVLAGCGSDSSSGGPMGTTATAATELPAPEKSAARAPAPVTSASSTARPSAKPPAPRVALTARGLSIDGRVAPILGGDLQYFRIRDPLWGEARTHALWEEAIDQAQAAGVNLVATYVPWEFHEETEGDLDWSGARDLEGFLEACHARGISVHLKPGPFINAEWPNGFGSFGGVPGWWKESHPEDLARGPDGLPFSFDLLGRPEGRQPSFFSPTFRAAAARWFKALAPIVKKYVVDRPTIVMIQIDNETNFYFKSRFSSDYSVHGVSQYHAWLEKKYGKIEALDALYGTAHASFADVVPPRAAPSRPEESLPVQDWFDAGKDGIAEWQLFLRSTWESLGIKEPWVLFTTNDSPHPLPMTDLVLWDGPTKNKAGLAALDAYPKQWPWSGSRPSDYPFLTSFFTKRFLEANGDYSFAGAAPTKIKGAFAAELEGGLFTLPLGLPLEIPPHATDTVLLEFFGHGGVLGTVYVFRGGLNHDGSRYFETACVDPDGRETPRYDLVRRFGKGLLEKNGAALLASEEPDSKVALVVGARFDAPAFGIAGHPGWIQAKEAPAVLGWLEDGGLSPQVIDGRRVKKGDLGAFKAVFYVNPDVADDDLALALDDYVKKGGTLVNFLHAGKKDGSFQEGKTPGSLLADGLFAEGRLASVYEEKLGFLLPPHVNFALPTGLAGYLATSPFLGQYDVSGDALVFARDRTAPWGADGKAAGWQAKKGSGQVFFLATNPARVYRDAGYYDAAPDDLLVPRAILSWISKEVGLSPLLSVTDASARAFARKVPSKDGGGALVFLASRLSTPSDAPVKVLDLAALG